MRSGLEPHLTEVVESGSEIENLGDAGRGPVNMQASAPSGSAGEFAGSSTARIVKELVDRLGGEHAVVEQLTACLSLNDGESSGAVSDSTEGYCYLRLFDRVEWRDASKLGPKPTVAELRRYSNGRSDPFGSRSVVLAVRKDSRGRVAHVEYNAGDSGLRPVQALAALSKDCEVGGIPDGPASDFPPSWIPAKLEAYQCWDYIPGNGKRNLDFLSWVGEIRDEHNPVSHETTRVRWVVTTSPVGPETANVDIIPPSGKTMSTKRWTSNVAHTKFHQDWAVRGDRVFVEAYVWRAAKFTTTPGAPMPTPKTGRGDHGELFASVDMMPCAIVNANGDLHRQGFCYLDAVVPSLRMVGQALGPSPKVTDVLRVVGDASFKCGMTGSGFEDGHDVVLTAPGMYHVVEGSLTGDQLHDKMLDLPSGYRIGATQTDAVVPSRLEDNSQPAQLVIRPSRPGMVINVPFAAKLTPETPVLYWDLTLGKKLGGLLAHFESAEMESLSIKATVHKGDGDTIFHLAADVETDAFKSDMDWVGAPHTLHVSGNSQGATTGEMVLRDRHGFGTQLKGAVLGNPTPIIQGWLETAVTANVLVKAILSVRVSGTGNPKAVILPARRAVGSMVNVVDDDSDDDEPVRGSPSGKHVGK